jgi:hypothetical protein
MSTGIGSNDPGRRFRAWKGVEPMVYVISTFLFFATCAAAVLFTAHRALTQSNSPGR